jgi:hypothetical protein
MSLELLDPSVTVCVIIVRHYLSPYVLNMPSVQNKPTELDASPVLSVTRGSTVQLHPNTVPYSNGKRCWQ